MRFLIGLTLAMVFSLAAALLPAQEAALPPGPLASMVKEIEPGVFQLGEIKINKPQRTATFPAVLNLTQGQMEYLLVHSSGKVHESILRTDTSPYRLNLALLLLGAKAATNNPALPATNTSQQIISEPSKEALPGEPVTIELTWHTNGSAVHRSAKDLVLNTQTKSVLRTNHWVYTGSRIAGSTFMAEAEGSIVSLVTDPSAMINYEGPGHDQDTVWTANTNSLPAAGLPVEVTIKLQVSSTNNPKR